MCQASGVKYLSEERAVLRDQQWWWELVSVSVVVVVVAVVVVTTKADPLRAGASQFHPCHGWVAWHTPWCSCLGLFSCGFPSGFPSGF